MPSNKGDHMPRRCGNLTRWTLRLAAMVATLGFGLISQAAEPPKTDGFDLYFQHVRPLLRTKCMQCHGPDEQEGKLRLDSREAILIGGKHGAAVKPGDAASLLLKSIRHEGEIKMPPKERLADDAVQKIEAWIK